MNCERAEAAVSSRLDGERLSGKLSASLESHLATCPRCRGFEAGARRLRERVRIREAERVPDLVGAIMQRVSAERPPRRFLPWSPPAFGEPAEPGVAPPVSRPRLRLRRRSRRELARVGVALLAGAIAGSAVVGTGLIGRNPPSPALAQQLNQEVARAAVRVSAYHVRFSVNEWHFQPQLPLRRFDLEVWFSAPERLRLDVVDHTPYPDRSSPRNDMTLIVNGPTWYLAGPGPCPTQAFPNCPLGGEQVRRVNDRMPFSSVASMPSDLVLPLATLAGANRLAVLGKGEVAGRPAMRVALPFSQAGPLFPFLHLGGAWRPFFSGDRVDLWLDQSSGFPLAFRVFPADGQSRRAWAARNGLPAEPPGRAVFSATATHVDERTPSPSLFDIPTTKGTGAAENEGARTVTLDQLSNEVGFDPAIPRDTAGLRLYRAVIPPAPPGQAPGQALVAYSAGLAWLNVREARSGPVRSSSGTVASQGQAVRLPGGGEGYYQPATGHLGRRLSIHAKGVDVVLESNLSRRQLLHVGASLPVARQGLPESWLVQKGAGGTVERLPFAEATRQVPFPVSPPADLPPGYALSGTDVVRLGGDVGINLYFQQPDADPSGQIRLHMEGGDQLPPASSSRQFEVKVSGAPGRFTPSRLELEWIQDGVYYELDGPGLALRDLLAIAESIPPPQPTARSPRPSRPSGHRPRRPAAPTGARIRNADAGLNGLPEAAAP